MNLNQNCPLCAADGQELFQVHGFWIRECPICIHRWATVGTTDGHVDRVYDDTYFTGGGAGYPDYISEGPLLRDHGRRYAQLINRYVQPGTVLDVGAAAGFFLQGFADMGWEVRGIEPNETMARYAGELSGIHVTTGVFEEYDDGERFDLVSMIQVLPHLVDPKKAMVRAALLTKPGGHLLIETWNRRSWTARLWGKRWHEYSPPSVLHWFTPSSVQNLAEEAGFTEIATGRPKKRLSGAHLKSLLKFKLENVPLNRLIRFFVAPIPNRLTLPYPAEDLFWSLFQIPHREVTPKSGEAHP